MTKQDDSLQKLDEIILTDHTGDPSVCIGLRQTFYLENSASDETRLRIGQAIEDYLKRYGDKIKKKRITCGKWRKTNKQSWEEFIASRSNRDTDLYALMTGAAKWDELNWYTLEAIAKDQIRFNKLAFVTFSIPLSALEGAPRGSFQQMMKDWIDLLKPMHAYGGFSAIFPIDGWNAQKLTYPLLMRFPGLDHDAPIWFRDDNLLSEVKGAHWLVYLNATHIEGLGGLQQLTDDLGEGFGLEPIGDGLLIQAGATPQLGDVNQNLLPQYYYRLGKVLAPIRVVIRTNNYLKPKGEDPVLKTQEWLARFD